MQGLKFVNQHCARLLCAAWQHACSCTSTQHVVNAFSACLCSHSKHVAPLLCIRLPSTAPPQWNWNWPCACCQAPRHLADIFCCNPPLPCRPPSTTPHRWTWNWSSACWPAHTLSNILPCQALCKPLLRPASALQATKHHPSSVSLEWVKRLLASTKACPVSTT